LTLLTSSGAKCASEGLSSAKVFCFVDTRLLKTFCLKHTTTAQRDTEFKSKMSATNESTCEDTFEHLHLWQRCSGSVAPEHFAAEVGCCWISKMPQQGSSADAKVRSWSENVCDRNSLSWMQHKMWQPPWANSVVILANYIRVLLWFS
jgi:hypothetical protein